MKTKNKQNLPEYTCFECGSSNLIVDEFNADDWEGAGEAELAERELGNHGTMTCLDCGSTREFDN